MARRTPRNEISDWLAQTASDNPRVRHAAVTALCPCHVRSNVPGVWDRLLAMTDDPDDRVRAQVLHALCDGSPRVREADVIATVDRLQLDPARRVRRLARRVMANYRATGVYNIL